MGAGTPCPHVLPGLLHAARLANHPSRLHTDIQGQDTALCLWAARGAPGCRGVLVAPSGLPEHFVVAHQHRISRYLISKSKSLK